MTDTSAGSELYASEIESLPSWARGKARQQLARPNARQRTQVEYLTRAVTTAPWLREAPRMAIEVVNDAVSKGDPDGMLRDLADAGTFVAIVQRRTQLQQSDDETQEQVWAGMPRSAQEALEHLGYVPPSRREKPDRNWLQSVVHGIDQVVSSTPVVADLDAAVRWTGRTAWQGVMDLSNVPGAIYRQNKITKGDPRRILDGWREAWHGERLIIPEVEQEVAERFADDQSYGIVKRLALGDTLEEIAADIADPTSPEFGQTVAAIYDFADNEVVRESVKELGFAKISPGRDLARSVGLTPGTAAYDWVSGGGDAAFTWFADPTLIGGKLLKAHRISKMSLAVGDDPLKRIASFYDEGFDTRALARGNTDVLDTPGYLADLRRSALNPVERSSTFLFDAVTQAAERPEALGRLHQLMPDASRLIRPLLDYHRSTPLQRPSDVMRFFQDAAGRTALARGDLVHYRYGFAALPRLNRRGTIAMQAKLEVRDALDFMADARVRLRSPIAQEDALGPLDAVQRGIGESTSLLLSPAASFAVRAMSLLPRHNYVVFGARESAEIFQQFLDYGVRGADARDLFGKMMLATDEATSRAVASSAQRTIFANLGLLDDPDMTPFVKRWLGNSEQRYALDDLDVGPDGGRHGIWAVDRAQAVAFPAYREVLAEVRRQRLVRTLTGFGGPEFTDRALRTWSPVAALPEMFMRVWRPAVLIRPAFAFRAGVEEALSQFARLGPGHLAKQWLLLPVTAADPGMSGWSRKILRASDAMFGLLPDAMRTSAASEARKVAGVVEAQIRRVGNRVLDRDEIRAWRHTHNVDLVNDAFAEIAGHHIGIQGAVVDDDPRTLLSMKVAGSKGPVELQFRRVNGEYDEYAVGDPLQRQVLSYQLAHLSRDPVAQARLRVRSLWLDDDQARRLGGVVGDLPATRMRHWREGRVPRQPVALPTRPFDLTPDEIAMLRGAWVDHSGLAAIREEFGPLELLDDAGRPTAQFNDVVDELDQFIDRRIAEFEQSDAFLYGEPNPNAGTGIRDFQQAIRKVRDGNPLGTPIPAVRTVAPASVVDDVADARAAVGIIRAELAQLPQPVRDRLHRIAMGPDVFDDVDAFTAEVAKVQRALDDLVARRRTQDWVAQIPDRFTLLNPSERAALLANPRRVFADVDRVDPAWDDLLVRIENGDRRALDELEDLVGVARWEMDDMADALAAMDRQGGVFGVVDDERVLGLRGRLLRDPMDDEALQLAREVLPESLRPAVNRLLDPDNAYLRVNVRADWDGFTALRPDVGFDESAHATLAVWNDSIPYQHDFERILDALPESGISRAEAMRRWSAVQRRSLDQLTLDDEGRVVHAITNPIAGDRFDPRTIRDATFAVPTRVHGPKVQLIEGKNLAEKVTNGFFDWAGGVIRAMARQPLWQQSYAVAWREADLFVGRYLRDPDAVRALGLADGKRDDLADALMELDHRMEEAFRSGAPHLDSAGGPVRNFLAMPDEDVLATLRAHGIRGVDVAAVRRWWTNERMVQDHVARIAVQRATVDAIPYIDDFRIRSQMAETGRNLVPFWFAQEQFYKRWARTFRHSPEALARMQLAHNALNAVGWVDHNEHGEQVFVQLGGQFVQAALTKTLELFPGESKWSLPVAATLTGQLEHAIPGFDDLAAIPQGGPLIAAPVSVLRQIAPPIGTQLERALINERGQGRTVWEAVMPTSIQRLWSFTGGWNEDAAMANSLAAIQLLEASGHGLQEGASTAERQVFFDRVRNWSRTMQGTKFLVGLFSPASPSVDLTPENLSQEYQELLRSGVDIDEAHRLFVERNPDAAAWTVFATTSPSKAPTNPNEAALQSLLDHDSFYDRYQLAGAWFLPQTVEGLDDEFNRQAWREMLSHEIRVRRGPEQMWEQLKYAQAAPTFFTSLEKFNDALANAGSAEQRNQLRAAWRQWKGEYFAAHPIFAEKYESADGRNQRAKILTETVTALDDPDAPMVPHADQLRTMISSYQRFSEALDASMVNRSKAGIAQRKQLRAGFDEWATAYVEGHPTVEAFYLRIIKPDLQLPTDEGDE